MGILPEFNGRPLIQIGFLEGDFGQDFLLEYYQRVDLDFEGNNFLDILKFDTDVNVVTGSNPFAVVLADQILRQEKLRVATNADLEKAMRRNILELHGIYEDTALVLRTEEEDRKHRKNIPIAKYLGEQLRARKMEFSSERPVVIPLNGLELQPAKNGYGLTFKLKDDPKDKEVPYWTTALRKSGAFNSIDVHDGTGLPVRTYEKGERLLTAKDFGLSVMCFAIDLGADSGNLGYSHKTGRIVAITDEERKNNPF